MYTIKKIEKIFHNAMEYHQGRLFATLDDYLRKHNLSSNEWSQVYRNVRKYITENRLNLFLMEEYFKREYIHILNQQHLIVDIGETCSLLNLSQVN